MYTIHFTHIDECNALINDKRKIKLIEKQGIIGNYQFEFFISSTYFEAKKLDKISIKRFTDQAERNAADIYLYCLRESN